MWTYKAKVVRVVDGDTVDLSVDLGFKIYHQIRIRLESIDAPELRRGTEEEKQKGRESRDFLKDLIEGSECFVRTKKTGKYGRWIGILLLPFDLSLDYVSSIQTQKLEGRGEFYSINQYMVLTNHAIYKEY